MHVGGLKPAYGPIPVEALAGIRAAAQGRQRSIILDGSDHKVFSHLTAHSAVAATLARCLPRVMDGDTKLADARIAIDGSMRALRVLEKAFW